MLREPEHSGHIGGGTEGTKAQCLRNLNIGHMRRSNRGNKVTLLREPEHSRHIRGTKGSTMLWEPEHMAYKEKEQKEQRHIA